MDDACPTAADDDPLVRTRLRLDRAAAPATAGAALRLVLWLTIALPALAVHLVAALVLAPALRLLAPLLERRARRT